MVPRDEVEELIGFQPGGVCPFAVDKDIPIWLDVSIKRFDYVHPMRYILIKDTWMFQKITSKSQGG